MSTPLPDFLQQRHDRDDLKKVIVQEIKANGSKCNLNHLDISHIRNMEGLFEDVDFDGDISKWDVSRVRIMNRMFKQSTFNGDISKWDTSSVLTMDTMFARSLFNGDISKWSLRSVVDTTSMFYYAQFNGDISEWNLSSAMRMSSMFMGSQFTGDLSKWQIAGVGNLAYMFKDSQYNRDLSAWTINALAFTEEMFCRSAFQGVFPNIDLKQFGRGVMLDASYRGRFPASYTLEDLSMVFGGSHPIDAYVRETSGRFLNRVHIEHALLRPDAAEWLPSSLLDWFENQKRACQGLGLDIEQATSLVYQQYQQYQQYQDARHVESWDTIAFSFNTTA